MMESKKTPLPVSKTENGNGGQLFFDEVVTVSDNDGITPTSRNQVEELLPRGAENAISAATLRRITGCRTTRALRKRVAWERENGALILSLPTVGYFLPDEGEKGKREARAFIASMTSRARSELKSTEAARKLLEGGR